jgi:hypothetical protein
VRDLPLGVWNLLPGVRLRDIEGRSLCVRFIWVSVIRKSAQRISQGMMRRSVMRSIARNTAKPLGAIPSASPQPCTAVYFDSSFRRRTRIAFRLRPRSSRCSKSL